MTPAGFAFWFVVNVGAGIWTPPEEIRFPTRELCEAGRQGVEDLGAHTTDCMREKPTYDRYGAAR